jgi:hypothetical protein
VKVLFHLARLRNWLAQVTERFAGGVELRLPLYQPILDNNVAIFAMRPWCHVTQSLWDLMLSLRELR